MKFNKYYIVKVNKAYECLSPSGKNGSLEIFTDDVLTGNNGLYTRHTGTCRTGIKIPDEDLILIDKPISLSLY